MSEQSEYRSLKAERLIASGSQKKAVFKALRRDVMNPTVIRKRSMEYNGKIDMSSTSKILRIFVEYGLAECINEGARTGRLYRMTKFGEEEKEKLKELLEE